MYRHFPRASPGLGLDLDLVECTKKVVFDSHISNIGKLQSGSLIVTSVLANFIVDGCRDLDDTEVTLFAKQQITAHVERLESLLTDSDSPDAVCIIVPPLRRTFPGECLRKREKKKFFCLFLFLSIYIIHTSF